MKRVIIVLLFLIAGCNQNISNYKEILVDKCIQICQESKLNLSDGPCLGSINERYVCDVAHNPRKEIDNKPENQCKDINGKGFIEVDTNCKFIRIQ